MKPLSEDEIRDAFENAAPEEIHGMPLPGLHEVVWSDREYLGWRDPQAPHRGYVVFWREDRPVGLALRASEARMGGGAALCSLCHMQQPADQVRMFSAPKAGAAGLKGDSVGTYICADLACSILIRMAPPPNQYVPNPRGAIADRADGLTRRLTSFADRVLDAA